MISLAQKTHQINSLFRISLSLVTLTASLYSADIFTTVVTNNTTNESYSEGFSSVETTFDSVLIESIVSNITYSDTDQLTAAIDFRGLPITLSYAANSSDMIFSIPSLNIKETFSGSSRNSSVELFKEWFRSNGDETVSLMMQKLAEVSPVDPVAGNPNSIMAMNVSNDFTTGFTSVSTNQVNLSTNPNSQNSNAVMIAPTFSSIDVDGKNSKNYLVPLSYSFGFEGDANEKLIISVPISYTNVEGAVGGSATLGLAYSKPITSQWVLTPSINYGAVASKDLGTFSQVGSASLTSSYSIELPKEFALSIGNMIGYYSTLKLFDVAYSYNPNIQNIVYRNGLMLSVPTDTLIDNTSLEFFAIDTRYTGSALYMEEYQEFGVSYGFDKTTLKDLGLTTEYNYRSAFKVGVTLLNSPKAQGYKINFGYIF